LFFEFEACLYLLGVTFLDDLLFLSVNFALLPAAAPPTAFCCWTFVAGLAFLAPFFGVRLRSSWLYTGVLEFPRTLFFAD